jgi:hypothetical protein
MVHRNARFRAINFVFVPFVRRIRLSQRQRDARNTAKFENSSRVGAVSIVGKWKTFSTFHFFHNALLQDGADQPGVLQGPCLTPRIGDL